MTTSGVLGLELDIAKQRLEATGFQAVEILESGRRREGRPRVIRQKILDGKVELVVSYFKELKQ
jgi:hypothetical protein